MSRLISDRRMNDEGHCRPRRVGERRVEETVEWDTLVVVDEGYTETCEKQDDVERLIAGGRVVPE